MALHMLLGPSGSGKTHRLYHHILMEALSHPECRYLVIVPEQYTMAIQRKLVAMHPQHALMNIDILSFQRLAVRVFSELGIDHLEILDDTGKSLILRKVMEAHRGELKSFAGNLDKNGFVGEVKSVLSEFLQYAISPQDMEGMITAMEQRPSLAGKLKDIRLVYQSFLDAIQGRYVTTEGLLPVLGQYAADSALIQGSILCLDGFTGFTPVQYNLLGELLSCTQDIYVTVTVDRTEPYNVFTGFDDLFGLSKDTIARLSRLCDERRVEVSKPVFCEENRRFHNAPDLRFLEENLFRYNKAHYGDMPHHIRLFRGENPKEEMRYVAAQILELSRKEGIRYRDIAVVSADIERYGNMAGNILAQNDIPAFVDYKRSIMRNPLIVLIRTALNVLDSGYSYDSVFAYLRTGLTGITREETDILENYCLALGIRGKNRWNSQWTGNYATRGRRQADLEYLNGLRYRVVQSLEPIENIYTKAKGSLVKSQEMLRALYDFLVAADAQNRLASIAEELEERGERALSQQYAQIYGKVIELLDKMYLLMGEDTIPKKEFAKLLDAGFENIKVGLIPPTADCVLVGDIERTRLDNIKILFFVGVNDGLVPKRESNTGILSELDRAALEQAEYVLSDSVRKKTLIQRFYLYQNLTRPSVRLYLTLAAQGMDGSSLRPSYLVHMFMKLFPRLQVEDCFRDIWLRIPKASVYWQAQEELACLKLQEAGELYGNTQKESVTRLEQFASCEFAHFMQYGLQLAEREEYFVAANDIGSMIHKSMEGISREIAQSGIDLRELSDEARWDIVSRTVERVAAQYGNAVFADSSRNEYMLERIKRLTDRTVWAMGRHLEEGAFAPEDFEVKFSLPMHLKDAGKSVTLTGSIDRVDICEDSGNVYVRVIDYKTGNDAFELYKTYYGLKLQLITYLEAAVQIIAARRPGKNVIPAGAFYYNVDDPLIDVRYAETFEESMLKELAYNGIANHELPEGLSGHEGAKNAVSTTQMKNLGRHLLNLMDTMVDEMIGGGAARNPYADSKTDSCRYCAYRSICGFYTDLPGCQYRKFPKLSDADVWKNIWDKSEHKTEQEDDSEQ